jgi:hypothetical protein
MTNKLTKRGVNGFYFMDEKVACGRSEILAHSLGFTELCITGLVAVTA